MWENRFFGEPSRGSIRDEIRSTFSSSGRVPDTETRTKTRTKDAVCAYF
jgi:hypothetical protein